MKNPKFKIGDLVIFERHNDLSTVKFEGAVGVVTRRLKNRTKKFNSRACCAQTGSAHDYFIFILGKEIKVCENLIKHLIKK